ncbi:hypothetical protein SAMN05421823_102726 [Catalinimonas alkaloidigena]|uniref:Uncharacterized protein n=1 Tax=Catalinimonas alkaloidigena TaxID=1075417 RepID=A0A1G9BVL1_9BACT|nr:hypothetical protein SAMN05421823_102726 [Catalinimonas alkaloidigena]
MYRSSLTILLCMEPHPKIHTKSLLLLWMAWILAILAFALISEPPIRPSQPLSSLSASVPPHALPQFKAR